MAPPETVVWPLGDLGFKAFGDAGRKTSEHVKVKKDGIWELLPHNHFFVPFQTVLVKPGRRSGQLREVS